MYINSIKPVYLATKMLQTEELTLGSFYGIWEQTKSKLKKVNTVLSIAIVNSMNIRQEQFYMNLVVTNTFYYKLLRYKINCKKNNIQAILQSILV